ncbi:N-acetylmuramyl-L-alanine amidase, negative regulator of AmpC, AmpD [Chloroherpeton thalassium ATCC 35110]|uniref:N-acetylmuramoyl-L-alanine amidase n=1 Tax=Chloroherpeton thalassium (strain ATCC 35110 / GB-78) TaxID=517418 RepID=B3QXY2_CHLT3|nr:N-acetylmuramoyl-L-alanine amidase [Chloroherpeton thalassium]ACF13510.1 N-acetylmuramyl-L-alanine amidase, negative regulator of AmpC, AmpD [Chloroherpeton thalassium ATCC 35110]
MNLTISNHLLQGEAVCHDYSTPNHSGTFSAGKADTIVIHYTAGRDARSSVQTLCSPDLKASAHLVIGRNGEIYQLAPFDRITWHAGKSNWHERSGLNQFSIGIEIDNAGRLTKQGTEYLSWFGKSYAANEVFSGVHRHEQTLSFWHRYTEAQILLVEEICRLLRQVYDIKEILGHEEISPGRKTDPGPAFPLDVLRNHVLYTDRKEDSLETDAQPIPNQSELLLGKGIVSADLLNIRYQPNERSATAAAPLPKGTLINILDEKDGWYKVQVQAEGWVSSKWVEAKLSR